MTEETWKGRIMGLAVDTRAVTLRSRSDCTINTRLENKEKKIDFESNIFNSLFSILYNTAYARQLCFLALCAGSLSGVFLSGEI